MLAIVQSEAAGLTWQAFLIGNLVGLLALSFWLGKLKEQVTQLQEAHRLHSEKMDKQTDRDVVVAELRTTMVELQKQMQKLTDEFAEFRQSVWARAIELGQPATRRAGG